MNPPTSRTTTSTTPSLAGEDTLIAQESTRLARGYYTGKKLGDKKSSHRRVAQVEEADDTVSSSRDDGMPKQLLRRFKLERGRPFRRRGATTGADNPPNNPTDDIKSGHSPTPEASPSSVGPECSGTSSFLYSSSLGSLLVDWVSEQSSRGVYSPNDRQALEDVLTELKNTQPEFVSVKTQDGMSFWNTLKGRIETIIGVLDWRPFQPYMAPLTQDQVRLCWECPCGDMRWAAVPQSFGLKIEDTFRTNAAQVNQKNVSGNGSSLPAIGTSSQFSGVKTRTSAGESVSQSDLPTTVKCQSSESSRNIGYQLHAFLVLLNSSIFGSAHCLVQTTVHKMNDHDFFTWIRDSYYSHRGFLAIWFGLYRYAHCEFFRFRRFDGYEYAPLLPEYPDEDQPFYHYAPKPMRPRPPMASHEFNHWFYKTSWSRTARLLSKRHRAKSRCFSLGSRSVVEEKIPKRETSLEEGVPACEDFWGLYVVERRSAFRLAIYSLIFLSPSVYFFFAWLFQWGHAGDLQGASIPIMLSLAPLVTFWGFVLSTSPRFDNT
ncbi:hypothetical protein N7491_010578 [Penicillium cf. griseofulvum]|uniref:Uncharacterized protein n=1 Tax=Penicillium cf. griseofulvum TaxID=2972120 RepID=A0A9W9T611_9EURO|nr:hypothetical protein N7472_000906 [Penicillium cf. griseofulvum]KAJ5422133.1 hypothetical protein N7491_010578 [Penicillium cf. griseofulvum]